VIEAARPPDDPVERLGRIQAALAVGERGLVHAQSRVPGVAAAVESFEREQRTGAGLLAGGLAYRLFFWVVPFGLVIAGIGSFWAESGKGSLESTAKTFGMGAVAARSASSAFESEAHARWYFLGAGTVLLFYFGLGAVRALRIAAFLAWGLKPRRLTHVPVAALAFTLIVSFGIAVSAGISWARANGHGTGLVATVCVAFVYLGIGIYTLGLLPRPEESTWRAMLPGAVLFAVGSEVIHLLVVYYLAAKLERSPSLYGSLGAATVVLLWLYMTARLMVSALFLNATVWRRRTAATP
jgi:uncharacterized BrkB/YihY/UPF0761 family membrane protein